ncbi:MAG: sulfatase-like hydrolase/transferase [Bacteroidales bacterium]
MEKKYKFSYVYDRLWSLTRNLLLSLVLLMICRLIFYWENSSIFGVIASSEWINIFQGGLRFDLSALMYANLLYILMMIIPANINNKIYNNIAKWIFVVTNSILNISNLADSVYFPFNNVRTTARIFTEFSNDNNIAGIIGVEIFKHWYLTLTGILFIIILIKFYRKPKHTEISNKWIFYISKTVILGIVLFFTLTFIRGGIGRTVRPITLSNATKYVSRPLNANIVLNTPFSIIRSIGKPAFHKKEYFKNEKEMLKYFNSIKQAPKKEFKPLNIVVLITESFGREYSGYLNKDLDDSTYTGYTPFLDSLMKESLCWKTSYSNGRKSIDAMPSILCSIPMFKEPFFLTPYALNDIQSMAGLLKDKSYYSAFFHGGKNGTMGFAAFANTVGFDDYYGMTEYCNAVKDGEKDWDGHWGIWDEEFYQYEADEISTFKQPFFVSSFSVSSHHPFNVPDKYKGKFPMGHRPMHQCIGYLDYSMKQFFKKASKEPWFDHTLFVITGDHSNQFEHSVYATDMGLYTVPIIFYQHGNKELKGLRQDIAEQTDIMPTILNYLGYNKSYVAFGKDLLNTPSEDTYSIHYSNSYQMVMGNYFLEFDGNKITSFYNYKNDPLLKINLIKATPKAILSSDNTDLQPDGLLNENAKRQEIKMLNILKSKIQQYMQRMCDNELVIKTS